MGAVEAVLFALEETLVPEQTLERWQWSWRPQGPVLPERRVHAAVKRSLHAWDRRRWEGLTGVAPPVDAAAYREHLRATLTEIAGHPLAEPEATAVVERFQKAPQLRPPPAEVAPTLDRLRSSGVRIGVLGARPGPSAAETVHRAALTPQIDRIAGTDPAAPWPPDPQAFRAAAKALDVAPRAAAFVGGLYWSEVRAAARVGFRAVLVDRAGYWPRVEGLRLTSLAGLPELLHRLATEELPTPEPAGGPAAPVGPS